MSFREVPKPPAGSYIEPPRKTGLVSIIAPGLKLFSDEIKFWRAQQRQADRAGNAALRRFAEVSGSALRDAAAGRTAVEIILDSGADEAEKIGNWYVRSTAALAISHMLKEVVTLEGDDPLDLSFSANIEMAVDYDTGDPHRSGMHTKEGFARNFLGLTPPEVGAERYYEGDVIYLHAHRPADPTAAFVEDYRGFYGVAFESDEYISFVPRLKSSYWAGDTPG